MAGKNHMTTRVSLLIGLFLLLPIAGAHASGESDQVIEDLPKSTVKNQLKSEDVIPPDRNKCEPDENGLFYPRAPYIYDPISKDVGDPTILFNHASGEAWVFYTQRDTMKAEGPGWYHGCDIGMQSSQFNGFSWLYRGVAEGLNTYRPGRNTFWAPEVVFHEGVYHMFVTFNVGVPMYPTGKFLFDETNGSSFHA